MYKKMFIFGLLLATLFSPLFAKQSLSLEQALQLAKANNLGLASNAIDVAAAKRDVDTSWNLFVPSVSLTLSNAGRGPGFVPSKAQMIDFSSFPFTTVEKETEFSQGGLGLSLGVSLTLNPAVKDQLDSYNLGYQIQQVTFAQAQAEVERNVTKLYYYLLMEAENIKVQEMNLELALKQYEQVQTKFESGFASEMEVLSSQLSYEQLKTPIQQAKNQYQSNLLSLKALLGLDLAEELEVSGDIPAMVKELEVSELREYLQKSYSLTLIDLNMAQLKSSLESNKKQALMPSLSLSTSYDISAWNESYSNTFSDSVTYSVGVRIPLDGFIPNSRTQVGLAKLEDSLDKLSLQRRQALQQLELGVVSKVQNLNMLASQAELAKQSLELTEKLYVMHMIQYESGYVTFLQ
ncbi:MAG: TolC family protein, partial [Candidatus Cloacimonetes bacterium]|nr:TolC family protein [Candidatus Cloacimonadota bacterium]